MVCFAEFQYRFAARDLPAWKDLLSRALGGCTLTLSAGGASVRAKVDASLFDRFEAVACAAGVDLSGDAECVAATERMWDEQIFWNMLPKFIAPAAGVARRAEDDAAVEALLGITRGDPGWEMIDRRPAAFDVARLPEILARAHAQRPIERAHLSPNEGNPFAYVLFATGHRIRIGKNGCDNMSRVVLDFDDGVVDGGTDDMRREFDAWKAAGDLRAPIFVDRLSAPPTA